MLILYVPQLFAGWTIAEGNLLGFLRTPGMFFTTYANEFYQDLFKAYLSPLTCFLSDMMFTSGLIAILTLIGARNRRWQIFVIIAGGICSILAALITFAWYAQGNC